MFCRYTCKGARRGCLDFYDWTGQILAAYFAVFFLVFRKYLFCMRLFSMPVICICYQDDIEKLVSKLEERVRTLEEGSCMDAVILPLHGSLPPELQVCTFFCFVFSGLTFSFKEYPMLN